MLIKLLSGWKMTICLGEVLLKDPHEFLLDESTATRTWNLDNGWKISYTIKYSKGVC
jgi:hypothetical protein